MSLTVIEDSVNVEKLIPTQDHLLVKVLSREKTEGGILLPKNEATACRVGRVLSLGKAIPNNYDGKDFPIPAAPGEYVLFMGYAGQEMKISTQDYRLIREHGLWAKVELSASGDIIDFESISPWAERVVLELNDETMTKSGTLYLTESRPKLAWREGKVKWAGFGVWHQSSGTLIPCESKPGDRVIFRRYSGENISVRGKEYRITQEVDVIAIVEGKGDQETLRPVRNKVLVLRDNADEKTEGGLVIPDTAKEKHQRGTVVALGAGQLLEDGSARPWELQKGDRVYFKDTPGSEVTHNKKQYVICTSEEIMGVIDGE